MIFWIWIEMTKSGLSIQIQNPILTWECQSQFNQPNWISIQIEQFNPTIPWPYILLKLNTREHFEFGNHFKNFNT
jgi:hypothetical protein